jgi:cytochrome b subunit of formate dehydrogenase
MQVNRYHKFLRTSMLIVACVLVFDSGMLLPVTKQLSYSTQHYLASVGSGMFASVPENEYNGLSAQLAEQQRVLDAREAALREREIAARTFDAAEESMNSTYVLSIILFILTVLVIFNYIMDFARMRQLRFVRIG